MMVFVIGGIMLASLAIAGRTGFRSRSTTHSTKRQRIRNQLVSKKSRSVSSQISYSKVQRRRQQYFKRQALILKTKETDIAHAYKVIELQNLTSGSMLEYAKAKNEGLENKITQIDLIGKSIELDKRENQHSYKEIEIDLSAKALELSKNENLQLHKEHELNQKHEALKIGIEKAGLTVILNEIKNGKVEVELGLKRLAHEQRVNEFGLQKQVLELKKISDQITISEGMLNLSKKQALFEINKARFEEYQEYLQRSHRIKQAELAVREREHRVNYREKKVELHNLYQKITVMIDKLRFIGREQSFDTIYRHDRYFKQFMNYHYEWIAMD